MNTILNPEDMVSFLKEAMKAYKKKEYLERHRYKLYQGKDGRWYTRLPLIKGGSKQVVFKSLEAAEEAIATFYEELVDVPTVKEIFYKVIDMKREEGSIAEPTYMRHVVDFNRYFGDLQNEKISYTSAERIEDFLRATKGKFDLSSKGYSHLLTVSGLIFRYAKKKKLIDFRIDDVISDMDWGKNAFRKEELDDSLEVFNDEEVKKLSDYFKEQADPRHLGLLLVFATGLRIGELAALKWEDVGEDVIFIRRTERVWSDNNHKFHCEVINLPKTRAGKRSVPIPDQAKWIVKELRRLNENLDGFVFVNPMRHSRIRAGYFRKALSKACKAVGIICRSPHKIRKTYASILLDNKVSEKNVIENMGHTDIHTTNESYARLRKSVKERVEVVSSVREFDVLSNGCEMVRK